MAIQMAEYVTHAVLRYYRRFDEYEKLASEKKWEMLEPWKRQDFTIGIMGMGVMGTAVAQTLAPFGFPIRGWSRHKKDIGYVDHFYGNNQLDAFLKGVRILVCLLPLTPETENILNKDTFRQLQKGAYLINLGRGAHLVEQDLLKALETGQIRAATLDVTREEPLDENHPFWKEDRISITPHIGGLTFCQATVEQVTRYIHAFEKGEHLSSLVDRNSGY